MNKDYLERKKRNTKRKEDIDISLNILFILKEINNNPLYPYAIKKAILGKYDVDIPIQSIYTTIKKYEKLKYITLDHTDDKQKKYYILTEDGQKFLNKKSSYSKMLVKKL